MDSDNKNEGIASAATSYKSLNESDLAPVAATSSPVAFVTAVAPADLPAGYRFSVVVDDKQSAVVVEVPPGGVKHGERFTSHAIDVDYGDKKMFENDGPPIGHWRDGLFDCFQLGLCHPLVWLSWCCYPVALGQVLTRLHLDWFGGPNENTSRKWSTFQILCSIWIAFFVFHYAVTYATAPYWLYGPDPNEPLWSTILVGIDDGLSVGFSLYTLIVMVRARSYMRSKYAIPEQDCVGCEDCCFSYFCHCCVIAQMARHVNDYERYPADCCSETGLGAKGPEFV